jgi:hypothetical protein
MLLHQLRVNSRPNSRYAPLTSPRPLATCFGGSLRQQVIDRYEEELSFTATLKPDGELPLIGMAGRVAYQACHHCWFVET